MNQSESQVSWQTFLGRNVRVILFVLFCVSFLSPKNVNGAVFFTSLQDWRDWMNGVGDYDPFPPKYGFIPVPNSISLNTNTTFDADFTNVDGAATGSYAFIDIAPHPLLSEGEALVTTVFGLDTNNPDDPMILGGFDPNSPILSPFSVETISGLDGVDYDSAPAETVALSDLSIELPGHDLSNFSLANPSNVVYLFRTIAPLNAIVIPEPATASLLLLGLIPLGMRRSRR